MINNLTNNQILAIVFVLITYFVLSIKIVKKARHNTKIKIFYHNEYTMANKKRYEFEIQSGLCQFCNRIDIIHIDKDRLLELTDKSSIGVGEYKMKHFYDGKYHTIIHYLDKNGNWTGDFIPSDQLIEMYDEKENTFVNEETRNIFG